MQLQYTKQNCRKQRARASCPVASPLRIPSCPAPTRELFPTVAMTALATAQSRVRRGYFLLPGSSQVAEAGGRARCCCGCSLNPLSSHHSYSPLSLTSLTPFRERWLCNIAFVVVLRKFLLSRLLRNFFFHRFLNRVEQMFQNHCTCREWIVTTNIQTMFGKHTVQWMNSAVSQLSQLAVLYSVLYSWDTVYCTLYCSVLILLL